ncbi:hypothetical protein [Comamonas sp. JUb58]|uniref:hypothetical protein n=1 Tax=Comamonas sp. JUb58 TaxID=2485114 RepID=UPI00105E082E|nr:hypothetical protein [Comamonas sp. JUb58]TDS69670.1 hypothetical protein EDF71_1329 [Comamonas sp. JUb58]
MSDIIPRAEKNATEARANPKQGRNTRPQPPMRCAAPAAPEPIEARDLLESIHDTGLHWWSIIDSLLLADEGAANGTRQGLERLPQWAIDRLKDQGRHESSYDEHRRKSNHLSEWLSIAEGSGSRFRFEIWTSKGSRLSLRHESLLEASEALDELKPEYPDAFIIKAHAMWSTSYSQVCLNPDLLDTLIGSVTHIGTSFGSQGEDDQFTVQDETGRQVVVSATPLRQHPVYDRLNKRGKEVVDHYLLHDKPRKEAIRKAAAERDAGAAP